MADFKTTAEINVPEKLIDQIIGQKKAVEIIKKAARQRRNVLLIGAPGTGKTLLAQAMAELLPTTNLEDVLVYKNPNDENVPLIKTVKTYPEGKEKKGDGQGRRIVQMERQKGRMNMGRTGSIITPIVLGLVIILFVLSISGYFSGYEIIVLAALILGVLIFGSMAMFMTGLMRRMPMPGMMDVNEPKLIVDNTSMATAPFIDATGSKAGALFGDVRHDPLQSGGLGTPAHLRVESGAIHKANEGILYIDEVSSLDPRSQQELLTAMQEKRYSITGKSEMSSGALVKTEPVPCDFLLVAAGNLMDIQHMHPALRSRIRGYGYEVYMDSTIEDNKASYDAFARFVAQEVKKDGRIPHFDKGAIDEIIEEARRRSGRKRHLSVSFRELGGLVRAAGDIAVEKKKRLVTSEDVIEAMKFANPVEVQAVNESMEMRKDYRVFQTSGFRVGRVNGLAVAGGSPAAPGLVLPIIAEVTPAGSKYEGRFIPTGKLGKIASEAVKNVSAIIKKHMGTDISNFDMHVQFLQTYEGIEGDSASVAVAVSILSAMENLPINQSVAMTGSITVRGEVLPVGGVTSKVEAAIGAGIKTVIVPASNIDDVYLRKELRKKVSLVAVKTFSEVIKVAMKRSAKRDEVIRKLNKYEAAMKG